VGVLVSNGNEVSIEHLAGEGSHYSDADYSEAGARIVFDRINYCKFVSLGDNQTTFIL
jgi:alanine dehydrogenase